MNRNVRAVFVFILCVASLLSVGEVLHDSSYANYFHKFGLTEADETFWLWKVFELIPRKIVLISHTVPMSLYLAIEALRWFQERKIRSDPVNIYPEDSNALLQQSFLTEMKSR